MISAKEARDLVEEKKRLERSAAEKHRVEVVVPKQLAGIQSGIILMAKDGKNSYSISERIEPEVKGALMDAGFLVWRKSDYTHIEW